METKTKGISKETTKRIGTILFEKQIESSVLDDLQEYINKRIDKLGCCVLYKVSGDFVNFIRSHGMEPEDLDRREVVIDKKEIYFSKDYRRVPSIKLNY